MKKAVFYLFLVFSFAANFTCFAVIPTNELPMYGNIPFTERQRKLTEDSIQSSIEKFGTREAASENALAVAWSYYKEGDKATAMKRFNQAWLLNPDSAGVFFGFGLLVAEQGKSNEAIKYYNRAIGLKPDYSMALSNLGREYYNKAYSIYMQSGQKDKEAKKYLNEALRSYEKAAKAAGSDETLGPDDLAYIYYQWAVSLEFNGEYAKSWEKIKICRKYGGKCIEPGFIKELAKFKPEPK